MVGVKIRPVKIEENKNRSIIMAIDPLAVDTATVEDIPQGDSSIKTFTVDEFPDRKSTRLNSSHIPLSRMPSSA